jgi:sulfatase modifying factor 1
MRTRTLIPFVAALFAASTHTSNLQAQPLVNIETVLVGDPGNTADPATRSVDPATGYGAVTSIFAIGKYEVTIAQYTAFLNSVARTNTASYIVTLWHSNMETDLRIAGISRSGSGTAGDPYTYSVIGPSGITPAIANSAGNRPIAYVSWFDAARFANWINNGATNGASTETGAYTLNGATNGSGFTRSAGARWWIPNENEWYKAAYYKGGGPNAGYWDYPTQSDTEPSNTNWGATNQANFTPMLVPLHNYTVTQSGTQSSTQNYLTDVGAFSKSAGAYGTFDQGGNVVEWVDDVFIGPVYEYGPNPYRIARGGSWPALPRYLWRGFGRATLQREPYDGGAGAGFRVASVASNASILPQIVSASHSSSGFSMTWTPPSNVNVQRRLDLNGAAQWTTVLSNVTGTNYFDQATPASRAFYRLALP